MIRKEEYEAKIVLEYYFPDRYSGLVVSDRPDIQDIKTGTGIEVVHAIEQKEIEGVMKWANYDRGEIYVGEPREYCGPCYDIDNTFVIIIDAFVGKIEKLQNYSQFSHYDLFMFATLDMYDDILELLCERLIKENVLTRKYRFVYVYSQGELVCFDLKKKIFRKTQVNQDIIDDLLGEEIKKI